MQTQESCSNISNVTLSRTVSAADGTFVRQNSDKRQRSCTNSIVLSPMESNLQPSLTDSTSEVNHSFKPNSIILTSPPKSRREMKAAREKSRKPLKESIKSSKKKQVSHKLSEGNGVSMKSTLNRLSLTTESRIHDTLLLSPRGHSQFDFLSDETSSRKSPKNKSHKFASNIFKFPSKNNGSPIKEIKFEDFQRTPKSPLSTPTPSTPGVVVTSYRSSQRRSSVTNAAVAFAAATAGATISPGNSPKSRFRFRYNIRFCKESEGNIVTRRALNILKHWVSKQPEVSRLKF